MAPPARTYLFGTGRPDFGLALRCYVELRRTLMGRVALVFLPMRIRMELNVFTYCINSTKLSELASTALKRRHHVLIASTLNTFGEGVLFVVPDTYPEQHG